MNTPSPRAGVQRAQLGPPAWPMPKSAHWTCLSLALHATTTALALRQGRHAGSASWLHTHFCSCMHMSLLHTHTGGHAREHTSTHSFLNTRLRFNTVVHMHTHLHSRMH